MSYYDVDAILTAAQKVPCTFQLDIPGLGFLDNNSTSTLKSGTKADLPLWLAEPLTFNSFSGSSIATLDLPSSLSPLVISALKASPKSVDLRAQAQHFYALAARMLEIFGDDEEGEEKEGGLGDVLYETFRVRAGMIGDHAANAGGRAREGGGVGVGNEGVEFLRGLEEEERRLFRTAHEAAKGTKRWMGEVKRA